MIWFVIGLLGCNAPREASQLATFAAYYAAFGMELGQVEEQFGTVAPQLGDAARDPGERAGVIAQLDGVVDALDAAVSRHQPPNPDAHAGHQAAQRMVRERRRAVRKLAQQWQGKDPFDAAAAVSAFTEEWIAAQQTFMAVVGQESQAVFGPAARKAQAGALGVDPREAPHW